MMQECVPGARAPLTGTYEQRDVLGALTGVRVTLAQGEVLPTAPRGFTWRMIETDEM